MGNLCGSNKEKTNDHPKQKHVVLHNEVKQEEHQEAQKEVVMCEEAHVEEKDLQTVPHPVSEHTEEQEKQRQLIEKCLEYLHEIPREGSVQNIQQDV